MSVASSTLEHQKTDMSSDTASMASQMPKPQRVLACVLCQQRKVKCDRKFPCGNCIKSRAKCVPATLTPRQRRRKVPDQELLERVRKYEDLLRQNNIAFEPFRKAPAAEKEPADTEMRYDSDNEQSEFMGTGIPSPSDTVKTETGYGAKNVWHTMSQGFRDPGNESDSSHDDIRETTIKKAWNLSTENGDNLLFGSPTTEIDLSTLHPTPVQIFRLWQIYVDNVNPLLKVTHTPSLQGQIIEAAGNIMDIKPSLEALLFSIYCTAVFSLREEDCQSLFASSREDLLTRYQFGCKHALLNCGILRTTERDCLTALYLYLITITPSVIGQSLYSILGVAIRIAYFMGIHNEDSLAKCSVLEAEMRRRLWWSLVIFDARISEKSNTRAATLDPTWDCRIPLNINDSDLRPEMKVPPAIHGKTSDALFAVIRGELGEFVRHSAIHLDFTNPALKPISKFARSGLMSEGSELIKLEEMIEDRYLRYCDEANPVQFMAIWTTRAYLAKCRLMEHHAIHANSTLARTELQRDTANSYALRMLECDTKIMSSPLARGFVWFNRNQFPFPAWYQIAQDLRRRPRSKLASRAWDAMSANFAVAFDNTLSTDRNPFFLQIFAKLILHAWEGCEAAARQSGEVPMQPDVVTSVKAVVAQATQRAQKVDTEQSSIMMNMGIDEFSMSMPMDLAGPNMSYSMGTQHDPTALGSGMFPGTPGQMAFEANMNQFNWNVMGGQPHWADY